MQTGCNTAAHIYLCASCRSFSEEVVLGYITQQGTVHLNPRDNSRPGPGSKLVLLSNGSEC